ncbi:MAG: CAP domain-containing protein [Candidatus Micrarchaeota archaeon]|nr:CAP domain-containing protein [Candidatus Micrarchaeota archaeon]
MAALLLLNIGGFRSTLNQVIGNYRTPTVYNNTNFPQNYTTVSTTSTSTTSTINYSQQYLDNYMLGLINQDRNKYGLSNVTLSLEPSAQQHSQSMLQYGYFSHWDIFGMKPYMRYTLLGGTQGVSENVAYNQSTEKSCIGQSCTVSGALNITEALKAMEYSMMYNDLACCNNGHRDNILDPHHNQVSIGIAYNGSTVYLTQDFVDNYINWTSGTPTFQNSRIYLKGTMLYGMNITQVEIGYEPTVSTMTIGQLDNTSHYGYPDTVAGVVSNSRYYYPNLTTITASAYNIAGTTFDIEFGLGNLTQKYGAGEYTVLLFMQPLAASSSNPFVGASYTIFINASGSSYVPFNI